MFSLILVPLDGSPFGERAIPLALRVARHTGAEVELVHVHEPTVFGGGAPMVDTRLDVELAQGMRATLERVRARTARKSGLPVSAAFLLGPVVPTLEEHVQARGVSLVVMTTHGRGGMSRSWLGSVADSLLRRVQVPVLIARARAAARAGIETPPFRRVLVPLDGSSLAEDALAHALAIGADRQTETLLLRVVGPEMLLAASRVQAAGPIEKGRLAAEEREAEDYLARVAERVRRPGRPVNTMVVAHWQPARAILDVAAEREVDLIALSTHGRRPVSRFFLGSVADKVIRGAAVPTLVSRPSAVETSASVGSRRAEASAAV